MRSVLFDRTERDDDTTVMVNSGINIAELPGSGGIEKVVDLRDDTNIGVNGRGHRLHLQ